MLGADLKSANLLIDDMGAIKIADFGLSRCQGSKDAVKRAMTGALGTFQWMAPEVQMKEPHCCI
jgi:serine/threonine protein kinase